MFYFDDFYGKKILKSTLLPDLGCFFTTRDFVLAMGSRNDLQSEAENNMLFLEQKLNYPRIITAKQTHSSNAAIVSEKEFFYDNTDSLISNIENTLLILNFADCVPIILYSRKDNTGAIIHAGWRGTADKIAQKTVSKMKNILHINPENITALIGPSIGKCCFETDEDVFLKLIEDKTQTQLYNKHNEKYFIDLKLLNKFQLEKEGVKNIDICSYCTCCMSDIFFSYRKEQGITARHSAVLQIKRG